MQRKEILEKFINAAAPAMVLQWYRLSLYLDLTIVVRFRILPKNKRRNSM